MVVIKKQSAFQMALCPDLPQRDIHGQLHGASYRYFLTGRKKRIGTTGLLYGVKTGRRHQYLSKLELDLHSILELKPEVVDFREQYPIYAHPRLRRLLNSHHFIQRNEVMTIDVVATLRSADGTLSNHAIAVKYSNELNEKEVWKRFVREQRACKELGWKWTVLTEREISKDVAYSADNLLGFTLRVNSNARFEEAKRLAQYLKVRVHRQQPLNFEMAKAAKSLKCSLPEAYQLLGIACVLGYLRLDLSQEILPNKPLFLR